jgi:hypothetical protein
VVRVKIELMSKKCKRVKENRVFVVRDAVFRGVQCRL